MSDPTIFNSGNPAAPAAPEVPNPDISYATELAMILNEEGKQKYANVTEALKGASHAQNYIADLKRQLQEAQSNAAANVASKEKQDELERTVRELLNKQTPTPATPASDLSADKIAEMVEQTLSRKNAAEAAKANQAAVVAELTKAFGEQAEAKYVEAAKDLGISVDDLNVMAAKSPKAVLKALGVGEVKHVQTTPFSPPASAVNPAGFQPHQDTLVKRNDAYIGVGATTEDLHAEAHRAKRMVDEMHAAGAQVGDLSDPKVYFKYFGK